MSYWISKLQRRWHGAAWKLDTDSSGTSRTVQQFMEAMTKSSQTGAVKVGKCRSRGEKHPSITSDDVSSTEVKEKIEKKPQHISALEASTQVCNMIRRDTNAQRHQVLWSV